MAGKQTSLLTGSNAKIKVNGVTLAYATDISYAVQSHTIPVETMGRYEVVANEPIALSVSGSFAVVRYTAGGNPTNNLMKADSGGNGIGKWGTKDTHYLSEHVDPAGILLSKTFDIEIYRKGADPTKATKTETSEKIITITDCRIISKGGSLNKRGMFMESFNFVATGISDDSYTSGVSGDKDLST